ncbi:MAG: hypothetical protein CMB52_03155 [Euryarchaeota archaeon]|nr:hypothetical protein [Euryarchaeota archaeon]|tara:strand:+ start:1134 stop:3161 length:2028 start_codon:yes stop_codon:yes gene_type:complete
MEWWFYTGIAAASYMFVVIYLHLRHPEKHLNWGNIELSDVDFPPTFSWGVATASHQIEGNNHNNWTQFEVSQNLEISGLTCDHWSRWKTDFDLVENLGVGHYRFSLEWSRLEPEEGEWDQGAIEQYSMMIDNLIERKIEPMVTLHHFSHPVWFEAKGGFAKAENIDYWVRFSEKMFSVLGWKVKWWCTINEPAVFASMGYVLGEFPPGKRSFGLTRSVSLNLMRAHARCYRALKSLPGGEDAQIGLVKNINIFDPYRRWNLLHWIQAKLLDEMFNQCWLRSLRTGKFRPPSSIFSRKIDGLRGSSDFIGVNYYTHLLTTPFMPTTVEIDPLKRPWEERTDFRYPMYAEGLRRSFDMVNSLNLPIIVTENGVADDDDDMRPEHIRRHLWITSQAIRDGLDIRGFYHWSLMDNFEWAEGYTQRFGLYHVDYQTQERTLKDSGKLYAEYIAKSKMPQVVVLAGGLGSRLGGMTKATPKSLIEVDGKPILSHILDWAHGQGCKDALILIGHLGEKFDGFSHRGMNLQFVKENQPLGTGGAIWNARQYLADEFILLWGDDYHPIDYKRLVKHHRDNRQRLTMTVIESHDTQNLQHAENRVIAYSKSKIDENFNGYEAGTSVVQKSVVESCGHTGSWSWEETVYPQLSGQIHAYIDETKFWDMGTPDRLAKLEKFLKRNRS